MKGKYDKPFVQLSGFILYIESSVAWGIPEKKCVDCCIFIDRDIHLGLYCVCVLYLFISLFIYFSLSSAVRVSYTITKTSNSISLKFLGHTKD